MFRDLLCQVGVRAVGVLKFDTSRPSDGCVSERAHQSVNDVLGIEGYDSTLGLKCKNENLVSHLRSSHLPILGLISIFTFTSQFTARYFTLTIYVRNANGRERCPLCWLFRLRTLRCWVSPRLARACKALRFVRWLGRGPGRDCPRLYQSLDTVAFAASRHCNFARALCGVSGRAKGAGAFPCRVREFSAPSSAQGRVVVLQQGMVCKC